MCIGMVSIHAFFIVASNAGFVSQINNILLLKTKTFINTLSPAVVPVPTVSFSQDADYKETPYKNYLQY